MRYLLASFVLSLLLTAGASLPAAAASRLQAGEGPSQRWSEGGRQRLASTRHGEIYYDEETTVRRRSYHRHDGARSRYTKRRHARVARHHGRRHLRTARKPGINRSKIVHPRQKPAQRTVSVPPVAVPPAAKPDGQKSSRQKPAGSLGMASYYWQPQALASGGRFDPNGMTAAHKSLPFGTRVRVTHLGNGRSVEVKINDRGPYVAGRIIDLSRAAAGVIGMTAQGVARVAVEVLGK